MSDTIKILIVDDDALNRFLLRHMLEQEGYSDCIEAADGHSAIALFESASPDLVLLDVIMPGMSGYEVAPQLKSLSVTQYLPVIFITSLEDKDSLVRCLEVGGDDFVSKPFDKLVLAAKIKAHTRIRQLGKHIEQQNIKLRQHQLAMEREHAIVEHIFQNVVYRNQQLHTHFDVTSSPAAQFCGDVCLHAKSPDGGAYYLIGDFTGHGLASAIGLLPVARTFNNLSCQGEAVEQIARTLNSILLDLLPGDMFFAATIGQVDESGRSHKIWQGGMPPMLVKSAQTTSIAAYDSAHMALGVLEDHEFDDACMRVNGEDNDEFLFFTDGLIEIRDDSGTMLSEAGIKRWFSHPHITSQWLYSKARAYQHAGTQADDMTIMLFRCRKFLHAKVTCETLLPFSFAITLEPSQLKEPDFISRITEMVCCQAGMSTIKSRVFTILSELLSNALEHGLLKLDSSLKTTEAGFAHYYQRRASRLANLTVGQISVEVEYALNSGGLRIAVKDTGDGFGIPDDIAAAQGDETHGRGLSLLHHLCQRVSFSKNGTAVEVFVLYENSP